MPWRNLINASGSVSSENGLPPRAVGVFVTARIAGFVVSNLGWQWCATHLGHRSVMRGVAGLAATAPLLVLLAMAFGDPAVRTALLAGAFALVGAAVSGTNIGFQSLLLTIAPAARRPSYVGLMNSFVGPFMLFPAIAGWLSDVTAPAVVFIGAMGAAALAWALAARLPQSAAAESPQPPGHP